MGMFRREEDYSPYVNKAKQQKSASGGSAVAGGRADASQFGAYASSGGGGGAGPRIPVWRRPSPTGGRPVPRGTDPFSSGVTGADPDLFNVPGWRKNFKDPGAPKDDEMFDEEGAFAQFGMLITNPDFMQKWSDIAYKAGLIGSDDINNAAKLESAWARAVGWSMSIAAATGNQTLLTPFEAAQMVADSTGSGLLAGLGDAKSRARAAQEQRDWDYAHFTGTRDLGTTTDTDQQAGVRNTEGLHQLLGRNPTNGELAAFQAGMNEIAADNPTITKRKGTFKEGKQTSQTDVVTGGFDETGAVRKQAAKASPEVAANQRATTYYDALVRAISAAV